MKEEINPEHQRYLRGCGASELVTLGPIKFIEGLRLIRQSLHSSRSLDQLEEQLHRRGIESDSFHNLTKIYAGDQAEWDEILGLIER